MKDVYMLIGFITAMLVIGGLVGFRNLDAAWLATPLAGFFGYMTPKEKPNA